MEPIRVLHVVTKMDRGGLETMVMNYYRNIDRNSIQFDFLTHSSEKGEYDDEILHMGGRVYHTYPIRIACFTKYLADLRRFFRQHKEYNIVHSHIDALSTFPLRAAKKSGISVRIAHSHNTGFDKSTKLPLLYLSKWMLSNGVANQYWGCSKNAVRFLFGERRYASGSYTVLNNAIDSDKFVFSREKRDAVREKMGLGINFVVGHIGRFVYQKNHEFLIDIFNEICKRNKDAVLLLIGVGKERPEIERKVELLGLAEKVKFLGIRSDISELLHAMDVFLLPSRFEGLPVVLVEGQAAGLPIFTSDIVTRDVVMTDLVNFISLQRPAKIWAEAILEYKYEARVDTSAHIRHCGYDIKEAAKKLSDFYLQA